MKWMILSGLVILLGTLGCAGRRVRGFDVRVPLACLTADPVLTGCELGEHLAKCDKALLKYRKGCEQVIAHP